MAGQVDHPVASLRRMAVRTMNMAAMVAAVTHIFPTT